MENLYNNLTCPILDVGKRMGHTKYIDFITWKEVNYPIMKGVDCCQRKFITLKVIVNQVKILQTFFQRYTGGSLWMACGHATQNLFYTSGGMSENQIEFIKKIIDNQKPILVEDLTPCLECFLNQPVELYDIRKINSALVIQKAWKQCRYNPSYKMCHTVQNKNLDIILSRN